MLTNFTTFRAPGLIRYNTIGVVHKYESYYKPIVLYKMARFYLVLLGRYDWR